FYKHVDDRYVDVLVHLDDTGMRMARSGSSQDRTRTGRWSTSRWMSAATAARHTCRPTSIVSKIRLRFPRGGAMWCSSTSSRCTARTSTRPTACGDSYASDTSRRITFKPKVRAREDRAGAYG